MAIDGGDLSETVLVCGCTRLLLLSMAWLGNKPPAVCLSNVFPNMPLHCQPLCFRLMHPLWLLGCVPSLRFTASADKGSPLASGVT